MIKSEQLKSLISMTPSDLTQAARAAGYKGDSYISAKFVGLSNGMEFCYLVSFLEEGEECWTKVYVTIDRSGKITVEY
jgi:hypothetical protein